jgi:hypothetical protein
MEQEEKIKRQKELKQKYDEIENNKIYNDKNKKDNKQLKYNRDSSA